MQKILYLHLPMDYFQIEKIIYIYIYISVIDHGATFQELILSLYFVIEFSNSSLKTNTFKNPHMIINKK